MATSAPLARAADGCFHPATEAELIDLVRFAHDHHLQLRVLGSTHSVWRAIVSDHFAGPSTPATDVAVVLDRYTAIDDPIADPAEPGSMRVTVQAGCHVGLSPQRLVQTRFEPQPAPGDVVAPSPWHEGSWETSLSAALERHGLAMPDLGGISHQTVAGFLSTGSSGGTVKWSVHECIVALRVIDGLGQVHDLTADGSDPEYFRAAGVAMGLCGVISTVTLRVGPRFDLVGSETVSATAQSPELDFYGDREAGLPTLEAFLLETDYARLMWWPQHLFDRLVVWRASRAPYEADRQLRPYREVAHLPVLSQAVAALLYTVLGNLDAPERGFEQLRALRRSERFEWGRVSAWLRSAFTPPAEPALPTTPQQAHPFLSALLTLFDGERRSPVTLGAAWVRLVEFLSVTADEVLAVGLGLPVFHRLCALLAPLVPAHLHTLLGAFVTTGPRGAPVTQTFADRGYLGLPMDNQMDDLLLTTWFTELWVPFTPGDGTVARTIAALRRHFDADGTPEARYAATGPFAFELYVAKGDARFFLSPATGSHVFRVDVFWYARNAKDPVRDFFPQFWSLLEPLGFRLHWGKFLPTPDPAAPDRLTRRFPDFARWQAVRERVDPRQVFLTEYWRTHLGFPR